MKVLIALLFLSLSITAFSQSKKKGKEKVVYKYKQYEKFDFDELSVTGEGGSPGDLSITPRFQKSFENKLPSKKNFNHEIRQSIDRIN